MPDRTDHTARVLLVGGIEVGLRSTVLDSLDMLGDPALQSEIKCDAVVMGVEEKIGGQPAGNIKVSRTERDAYCVETDLEGLLHRHRAVMGFMDRAENRAAAATRHLADLLAAHEEISQALSAGDTSKAQDLLSTRASASTAALSSSLQGIAISEDDVSRMSQTAPKPAEAPLLEDFVHPPGGGGVGGGAARRQPGALGNMEAELAREEALLANGGDGEGGDGDGSGEDDSDHFDPAAMGYAELPDGPDGASDDSSEAFAPHEMEGAGAEGAGAAHDPTEAHSGAVEEQTGAAGTEVGGGAGVVARPAEEEEQGEGREGPAGSGERAVEEEEGDAAAVAAAAPLPNGVGELC